MSVVSSSTSGQMQCGRANDGTAAEAASFAYRWALAQDRTEAEALATAGHAYAATGSNPVEVNGRVREIAAAEARDCHLWLKRPLRARVVLAPPH